MRRGVGLVLVAAGVSACGGGGGGSGGKPVAIPSGALDAGLRVSLSSAPAKPGSRTITFTAPVADDDGTAPTYSIDFGDGSTATSPSKPVCPQGKRTSTTPLKTTVTVSHTYKAAGTYPVRIEVTTGTGCTLPAPETQTALALVTVA